MKLLLSGLLAAGCGGKTSDAPKLDCEAFSKQAATGFAGALAAPVIQSAKDDCEAGRITKVQYDCVFAARTSEAVGACMKK